MTHQVVLIGDVRDQLATIQDQSVQCCVTSPPYYRLRDYGVAGQIGLEPTLVEYIATMVDVFRGVRRVLADDGVLFLNIGDSYANSGTSGPQGATGARSTRTFTAVGAGGNVPAGMKPKDLMMVPARLAIALQGDGWYLRSDIIWAKPNPMPESVRDRPASAHEHIFLLTKQARYFYDADAVREDAIYGYRTNPNSKPMTNRKAASTGMYRNVGTATEGVERGQDQTGSTYEPDSGRNCRNVWTITTHGFPEAHFATFPPEIPRRCIKAGSRAGDTILDPFLGSGTTLAMAQILGRNGIGIELNREYAELARNRISAAAPLFGTVDAKEGL